MKCKSSEFSSTLYTVPARKFCPLLGVSGPYKEMCPPTHLTDTDHRLTKIQYYGWCQPPIADSGKKNREDTM